MLLANCVRRINHIEIKRCFSKSMYTTMRYYGAMAGQTIPSMEISDSMRHLTSTTTTTTTATASSTVPTLFTKHHQNNGPLWRSHRTFSSQRNDKNTHKYDDANDEDSDDEDLTNWNRKLPRFDEFYHLKPSIYLMLKNALSTLLIQSYFDRQFSRSEFLDGAKQAVQTVSKLLAQANFDELQDMVDDDTIAKMRRIVGSMTQEQRDLLVVDEDDVQWIFPHEIQFITKEGANDNKSQFFVEIMVVVHAYRNNDGIAFSDLMGKPNAEIMDKLEKYYSVANYRFIKEFTKGVEDDWTINYILHVKPSDDMKETLKRQPL